MEIVFIAFIVIYGVVLGLMAPYLITGKQNYGALVGYALPIVFGLIFYVLLTWVGLKNDEAWIWLIVMLGMPAVMIFGLRFINARRSKEDALAIS